MTTQQPHRINPDPARLATVAVLALTVIAVFGANQSSRAQQSDIPVLPVPAYGQGSSPWGSEPVGGPGGCLSMWMAGCFYTSRAMVFSYYDGAKPSNQTPGHVSRCYGQCAAPFRGCEPPGVKFAVASGDAKFWLSYKDAPDPGDVDARTFWAMVESELRARRPVILSYTEPQSSSGQHMVVLTGRTDGKWIINDPMANDRNGGTVAWATNTRGELCKVDGLSDCRSVRFMVPVQGPVPAGGDWSPVLRVTLPHVESTRYPLEADVLVINGAERVARFKGRVAIAANGSSTPVTLTGAPDGTYDLYVRIPGFLSHHATFTIPLPQGYIDVSPSFVPGDIVRDDVINALDMSVLISDYYSDAERSDLNGDGSVNGIDYAMLEDTYGSSGALRNLRYGRPAELDAETAAPASDAQGRAWLEADRTDVSVGQEVNVHVYADPAGEEALAADLILGFDPGALAYVKTTPGPDFVQVQVAPPTDGGRGRLALRAYGDVGSVPLGAPARIATLTFNVLRGVEASTIALEHSAGRTTDSNLASADGVDLLAQATGVTLRLRGEPRPAASVAFLWPLPNKRMLATEHTFAVTAEDGFGDIERVEFVVRHNRGAQELSTDWDGSDGWTARWNPVQYEDGDGSAGSPWLPERFQIDARAYVRAQTIPAVIRSPLYEFAYPQYALDSIIVAINPGADIGTVVTRHGGTPDDAKSIFGAANTFTVMIPQVIDWEAIEPLVRAYNDDPDVDYAEVNGIFNTSEGAAADLLRRGALLAPGWNLIALPADARPSDVAERLAASGGALDRAYLYAPLSADGPWLRVLSGTDAPWSELPASRISAAWVHARYAANAALPASTAAAVPLQRGWNLWGFNGPSPVTPATALQSIAGRYDRVVGLMSSWPDAPWLTHDPRQSASDTLRHLMPGRAYWLHATDDVTLPNVSIGSIGSIEVGDAPFALDQAAGDAAPALPMTLIGELSLPSDGPSGSAPNEVRAMFGGRMIARSAVVRRGSRAEFALDIPSLADPSEASPLTDGDLVTIDAGVSFEALRLRWRSGSLGRVMLAPARTAPLTPAPMATATVPSTRPNNRLHFPVALRGERLTGFVYFGAGTSLMLPPEGIATGNIALDGIPLYDTDPDTEVALLCSRPEGCAVRFEGAGRVRYDTGMDELLGQLLDVSGCRSVCRRIRAVEALPDGRAIEEWIPPDFPNATPRPLATPSPIASAMPPATPIPAATHLPPLSLRGSLPTVRADCVAHDDRFAYVGDSGQVSVVDVTSAEAPVVVQTIPGIGCPLAVANTHLLGASGRAVRVVDVSDLPAAYADLGIRHSQGLISIYGLSAIGVSGSKIIASEGRNVIRVFERSDPLLSQPSGHTVTGFVREALWMEQAAGFVVANMDKGLAYVNASGDVHTQDVPGTPLGLCTDDGFVADDSSSFYVASANYGVLRMVQEAVAGQLDTPGSPQAIDCSSGRVYVVDRRTDGPSGVLILDADLNSLASTTTDGDAQDIATFNGVILLADGESGLKVLSDVEE